MFVLELLNDVNGLEVFGIYFVILVFVLILICLFWVIIFGFGLILRCLLMVFLFVGILMILYVNMM